jgi:hypothetical protein
MTTDVIDASGTWTCPAGVFSALVECVGAGGGGGGGATLGRGGSGAGAGAYSSKVVAVVPGTIYTVSVGAGGVGGTYGTTPNSTPGGDTFFDTAANVMAKGGQQGIRSSSTVPLGGQASASVGTTKIDGGSGTISGTGSGTDGGAGGSAPSAGSIVGGVGGAGGTSGVNGGIGGAPGAGGGGGKGNNGGGAGGGTGGAGAAGRVAITYTASVSTGAGFLGLL